MNYPDSYISYLVEYHATRDYFECHELLEEYWKEHPEDPYSQEWVALIQLAVGHYHERRGNLAGASKMYTQALNKLNRESLSQLGLDGNHIMMELANRLHQLTQGSLPYVDMNLNLIDPELMRLCELACMERGLQWGTASRLDDEALIHRHTLRDRSEVIAARIAAAESKKRNRPGAG